MYLFIAADVCVCHTYAVSRLVRAVAQVWRPEDNLELVPPFYL